MLKIKKKFFQTSICFKALLCLCSFSKAECVTSSVAQDPTIQSTIENTTKVIEFKSFYQGCLLFQDDIRSIDHSSPLKTLSPHSLIRSWYRFGEPAPDKAYASRSDLVEEMNQQGIGIGGGISLSVVNDFDLKRKDFNPSWLATNMDGTHFVEKDGQKYASLTSPGYRTYLVKNLIEQAKLGVKELHLGETNGKILYDDYSLGLSGDEGFIQWIKNKYPAKNQAWWSNHFGDLGSAIAKKEKITRAMFQHLKGKVLSNFQLEWGKPDSWHGKDDKDQPAFLSYVYKKNIQKLMTELKQELKTNGKEATLIDVWGTADWLKGISPAPDAVISSPPDERWGLPWNVDPHYDIQKDRERIKNIMLDEMKSAAPSQLIYMFDHPKPFLTSFTKLSDSRQAFLTRFFSDLCDEIGAKFALRSYSETPQSLGPETKKVIQDICLKQNSEK